MKVKIEQELNFVVDDSQLFLDAQEAKKVSEHLMHVKAWARPNACARKYTKKIEYYTEVWLYYTEAWLWLTWQSIKRVASEFRNA